MLASSTSQFQKLGRNRFFGAHSSKVCPDSNLNHRCSSSRRANCRRRDSRCQNRSASTNLTVRYCRTQQYSITALTDSSATIKERYAYDAYGNLSIFDASGTARSSTAEGNRITYTGREWDDELDLYHYRARMYGPLCGRFLRRDPIGFEGSEWNLLEYVDSAPANRVDPYGRCGENVKETEFDLRRQHHQLIHAALGNDHAIIDARTTK